MTKWINVLRAGYTSPAIDCSMSLSDAVITATNSVAHHLLHSEVVRAHVANLPKGPGTHCPDSSLDEIVKNIAIQESQMSKSDPVLTLAFLRRFMMPMFDFEREQVLAATLLIDDTTPEELIAFTLSAQLGRLHDVLWAKWFAAIVVPYQSLDETDKEQYKKLVEGQLAQYDYTVFGFNFTKGCINRRTWAVAFPDDIRAIVETIGKLALTLNPFADYLEALKNAYACTEIERLESLWAAVDWAWIKTPTTSRIIPLHGMEAGYEHPFGVSPEFRLEVRTGKARNYIAEARIGTIKYAESLNLSQKLLELTSQKLGHIDVSVFTCAIRAGLSLNFRFNGQNVPNREDVLTEGAKIFLNESSSRRGRERCFENLDRHCAPETAKLLKGYISLEALLAFVINHEFSHPVGCTEKSDKGIGGDVKQLLEEGKATVLGILADEWRNSTLDNRMTLIARTVARVILFMYTANLENPTFAPYVRENLVCATMLFESGVMELSENGIIINLEKAQSRVWFEHLKEFATLLIAAYQAEDKDEIRRLTIRYCNKADKPLASLIAWVNRN